MATAPGTLRESGWSFYAAPPALMVRHVLMNYSVQPTKGQVSVWDPLVRLAHWSLALATAVAWWTREYNYELHLDAGYAVLAIVIIRLVWGFAGPRYARFRSFSHAPGPALRYLGGLAAGRAPRFVGHSPAGAWMIFLLLAALFTCCLSGIALDAAENRAGPLASTRLFIYTEQIVAIHAWSTHVLEVLVPLHIAGVAVASWAHRENLVAAMLTGRKRAPARDDRD
jgi:cytochrome b